MKRTRVAFGMVLVLFGCALFADETAIVTTDKGESYVVAFDEKNSEIVLDDFDMKKHGGSIGHPRNYHVPLTQAEQNDIRYIMTTLANSSLISIAIHRSSLESAGDRIDHIHPFQFLLCVFSDEEMKVAIRNIRGRGWIWGDFSAGIKESLATEARNENLKLEYVHDLIKKVELPKQHHNLLHGHIQNKNWDELLEALIIHVPRRGDQGRYDS